MTWHKFYDIVSIRENYNLKYAEAITEIAYQKLGNCLNIKYSKFKAHTLI